MSAHLFGSVTLPSDLDHLVDVYRLHHDRGVGTATLLDGWRGFLTQALANGPLALMATACEHLSHFAGRQSQAVDELLGSAWPETIALGIACRSLQGHDGVPTGTATSLLPRWLIELESRQIVRASVRDESPDGGPVPWIVELDFGCADTSSINVWINPDGSLYQLYPSDETLDELQRFLGEINHRLPNRPFEPVLTSTAIAALQTPAEHTATNPGDRAMLGWLLRTTCGTEQ